MDTTNFSIDVTAGSELTDLLPDTDYGVLLGSIIGASVSVIASKEKNIRKMLHFVLALFAGILVALPASDLISQMWSLNVSPKITAIVLSSLLIPILFSVSGNESVEEVCRKILNYIERGRGRRE